MVVYLAVKNQAEEYKIRKVLPTFKANLNAVYKKKWYVDFRQKIGPFITNIFKKGIKFEKNYYREI